jgi:H+/gluconate symporter-like permease
VSTGFTRNFFVGVFVTCTPVPMVTVPLAVVGAFEVSVFVLPPPPQAANANELNATRTMPYVNFGNLIRAICCSCRW